jgi:hypothetical protein
VEEMITRGRNNALYVEVILVKMVVHMVMLVIGNVVQISVLVYLGMYMISFTVGTHFGLIILNV